jgi:hypothetical protein
MDMAWTDQPLRSSSGLFERRLAAISCVESNQGDATYSFSGSLRYVLTADRQLTIKEYSVRGIHLDGPDLGTIEYHAQREWQAEIASDRRFEVRGELHWTDRNNTGAIVHSVLRGTLLENQTLAYISTSMSGQIALGEACEGEVCLRTPALW